MQRRRPAAAGARPATAVRSGDVLTDRANMLIRRHRGAQFGATVGCVVHVFAHDHSVVARRQQGRPCRSPRTRRTPSSSRCRFACPDGIGGPHCDPIHPGGVEGRRRAQRPHWLGSDTANGLAHWHAHGGYSRRTSRRRACLLPRLQRLVRRDVGDECARSVGHRYRMTSTAVPPSMPVAGSGTTM